METILQKNISHIFLVLCCTLFSFRLSAQENTLLEIQGSVGLVQLLPTGTKGSLYPIQPGLFHEDIETLTYKGRQFDLGFLANRYLSSSWSIRSGLQVFELQGKINYQTARFFENAPGELVADYSEKTTTRLRGFQIPVLLGYHHPIGKWTAFAELGFSLAYAPVKIKGNVQEKTYYAYGIGYADSCGCTFLTDVVKLSNPSLHQYNNNGNQNQFEARGIFGLGILIPVAAGNTFRVAYQLSGSLHPLDKGTRESRGLYSPYQIYDSKYQHLAHQLSVAWGWPSKKAITTEADENKLKWKGAFVGTGISLLRPMQVGTAWGRHLELMYVSKWGFGARMEVARLVAPSSNYGIEARFRKVQLLYHLGYGVQFHAGGSWGTGGDGDGSQYKGRGAHAGGSVLLPLSTFMGLHVQVTGHHFFTNFGSENMVETGVGVVWRIWK